MIEQISDNVPKSPSEYIGEDGIKRCAVCGQATETTINILGEKRKVHCICDCRKKELQAAREKEEEEEKRRNRAICFGKSALSECKFENSHDSEMLKIGKRYAEQFDEFKASGKGLLFCGTVGTGKSHTSACIANRLIDNGHKVLMTNFATMVNILQSSFDGRQEYIDGLNRYALLIIDDLGAERESEYMQEQVFNIIDSRYRSGLPMIITTNLTTEEIKKASDIGKRRIYDRVLERCHPVVMNGQSIRRQKVKNDFPQMEMALKGEEK